jgi:hypothetical protein
MVIDPGVIWVIGLSVNEFRRFGDWETKGQDPSVS